MGIKIVMKRNKSRIIGTVFILGIQLVTAGCGSTDISEKEVIEEAIDEAIDEAMPADDITPIETLNDEDEFHTEADMPEEEMQVQEVEETPEPVVEILKFVDVFGEEYETEINPLIPANEYNPDGFIHDGDKLSYENDDRFTYRLGVDVSHHNGKIDWTTVKDQGYEFTIFRLGYRGYGKSGNLNLDRQFERNIVEAEAAGLDVGVYFFAQAVNEEEAVEEAEFVLEHLDGHKLKLPVVYDPESILDDTARTDNVSGEQFTQNTKTFCDVIRAAGYDVMIYSNMLWEAFELDLTQLEDIPVWYADYEELPQTPYMFEFWQYSNTGRVKGIDGEADMDIQLIPVD